MRNPLILLGLWTLGLASLAAAACSAPDPGVGYLGLSPNSANGGNSPTGPSGSDAGGGGPTGSTGATGPATGGTDSGTGALGEDGGAGNDGSAVVTFLGEATPWASNQQPVTTATQSMAAGTVVVPTPTTDCLTCHVLGGAASPYLAAGFVATTPGGTTGAVNVEVRVYAQGSDAGVSAYTDSDGYFWINPPNGGLTGPYNAGVRSGTVAPVIMPAAQTTIDCGSGLCHGGTADGPIHIP